jgi:hypothetical protein
MNMKKPLLVGMAILMLVASTLTGCLMVPVDDGYRGDNHHRGGHDGDRHDRR